MARNFLTHIDLNGNQIINAAFEKLSSAPASGNFEGRMYYDTSLNVVRVYLDSAWADSGIPIVSSDPVSGNYEGRIIYNTTADAIKYYSGSAWSTVGAGSVQSVTAGDSNIEIGGTSSNPTVSLAATIDADTSGNAATATYATTAGSANAVAANSVALGTDTTGDYVATIGGTDGVSISGSGTEGRAVTIANTDKGSSQNIFKNVAVTGQSDIVADNNNDTLTVAGGTGITVTTDATADTLTITNSGVTSVSGTANQISANSSTGSVTLSLPSAITVPGSLTLNADPTADLHAATKAYVDARINGLSWKTSANLLASSNVALTGSTGSLTIDSHSLGASQNGYRIVLTGQSTGSQNGIYVYSDSGSGYTLSRSADADVYTELIGASIFISEGTSYGKTSWVQSNHYLSSFSDQVWTQVAGTGQYVASNGLTLTGNAFSIDTSITVDKNTSQTLTNKTLTSPVITNPSVSGLYLSDNNIVIEGTADAFETTLVFTDPTADRTITFKDATGTVAFTGDITSAIDALSTSDIEEGTNLYYTDERAQDAVGLNISGSNSLAATYNDGAGTFTFDTTLATTSYMSKSSGLAVDISAVETKLTTDGYSKKVATNVGNGSATSFVITHGLGTRDVTVQVFNNSAPYDQVEVDVLHYDASDTGNLNKITVGFATAPTSNAYRVVVVG